MDSLKFWLHNKLAIKELRDFQLIQIFYWKASILSFLSSQSTLNSNFYPLWSYPTNALSMVRTPQADNHLFKVYSFAFIASWLCRTSTAARYLCSLSLGSCPSPPIFSSLYHFKLLYLLTLDYFGPDFRSTLCDLILMNLIFDVVLRFMIVRQLPHLVIQLLITFLEGWFEVKVLVLPLQWEILLGKAVFS